MTAHGELGVITALVNGVVKEVDTESLAFKVVVEQERDMQCQTPDGRMAHRHDHEFTPLNKPEFVKYMKEKNSCDGTECLQMWSAYVLSDSTSKMYQGVKMDDIISPSPMSDLVWHGNEAAEGDGPNLSPGDDNIINLSDDSQGGDLACGDVGNPEEVGLAPVSLFDSWCNNEDVVSADSGGDDLDHSVSQVATGAGCPQLGPCLGEMLFPSEGVATPIDSGCPELGPSVVEVPAPPDEEAAEEAFPEEPPEDSGEEIEAMMMHDLAEMLGEKAAGSVDLEEEICYPPPAGAGCLEPVECEEPEEWVDQEELLANSEGSSLRLGDELEAEVTLVDVEESSQKRARID